MSRDKNWVLKRVDPERRAMMERIISTGFAAPVMSSFSMSVLSIQQAHAQSVDGMAGNMSGNMAFYPSDPSLKNDKLS